MKLEQVSGSGRRIDADRTYSFIDPKRLGGAVAVWMWVYVASAVANIVGMVIEVSALSAMPGAAPLPVEQSVTGSLELDMGIAAIRVGSFLLYVVAGLLFLRWTYRVVKNARVMSNGHMNATPGWAVGWYFVPVAFLWKPVEYLRETWRASFNPSSPALADVPGYVTGWWTLWLVSAISGNIAGRLSWAAETAGAYLAANVLAIISDAAIIPAAFLLVRIVRTLSEQQFDTRDVSVSD